MKRIFLITMAIIMVFSLVSCAKPAAPTAPTEPAPTNANTTSNPDNTTPGAPTTDTTAPEAPTAGTTATTPTTGQVQTVSKWELKITDFQGRSITFTKPPKRIVSLSPSNTEIVFKLGAQDKLVGVTSYCDYPMGAKNIQQVGTFDGPNMELIKKVQPDVVLAGYIQEDAVKAMEDMGIKVVVTEAKSFEDIYSSIELIGKITGKEGKASDIVDGMKEKIAKIQEKNKDKNKPRVFYVVWTDPLTTAGSNTFINDVIKTAGGINVAEKAEGWAKYSAEQLLADDPDMIVAALHSTNSGISKGALVENPIFSKLDCVKQGKVYVMSDDNIISRPGPRIVQAIEEMEQIFYGE